MPDVKKMRDNLAVFSHRGLGKADPRGVPRGKGRCSFSLEWKMARCKYAQALGHKMEEGTVLEWKKKDGDEVHKGGRPGRGGIRQSDLRPRG